MIFGIKEVYFLNKKTKVDQETLPLKEKVKFSLNQFKEQVKAEKTIIMALMGNFCNSLQFVCIYQYGFLIYNI